MSMLLRRAMMGSLVASSSYDPYFEQVVQLLHMDGANAGTTFVDSSNAAWAVSTQNSPTTSTTQSKFGGTSASFPTNAWIYNAGTMPAPLTSDFTLECWVYPTSMTGNRVIFMYGDFTVSTGFEVYCDANGAVRMYSQSERWASANGVLSTNTWKHVAVTRVSGVMYCWVDGVQVATATWANSITAANAGVSYNSLGVPWVGFIDEYRYTRNVARYTGSFTPSITAFPDASASKAYTSWDTSPVGPSTVLTNNNLTVTNTGSGVNNVRSMITKASGKWYWEVTMQTAGSVRQVVGIATGVWNPVSATFCGISAGSWGYYGLDGTKWGAGANAAYGATFGTGDVIGIALDANIGAVTFYKNGVSQGVAYTGLTGPFYAAMGDYINPDVTTTNFGATAFAYSPPAGYNAGLYETTQYATWNPSDKTGTQAVLSNGNLTFTATTSFELARATMGKTSGKWYWEVTVATSTDATVGVANTSQSITGDQWVGISANSWSWAQFNGFMYTNNAAGVYASSMNNGDVIGLALDMDSKTISYYQNGVFRGFQIGLTGTVHPAIGNYTGSGINATANFGSAPFKHSVPPGYYPGIDNEPSISPAAQTCATWNPADKNAQVTLSAGNLTQVNNLGNIAVRATIGKTTGKWYWEVTRGQNGTGETSVGIGTASATLANWLGFDVNSVGYDSTIGSLYKSNAVVASGLGAYNTAGDTIGIALNQDAGTVAFYRNGVLVNTYTHGLSGAVFPMVGAVVSSQNEIANFGQYPFKYAVPVGFNPGVY